MCQCLPVTGCSVPVTATSVLLEKSETLALHKYHNRLMIIVCHIPLKGLPVSESSPTCFKIYWVGGALNNINFQQDTNSNGFVPHFFDNHDKSMNRECHGLPWGFPGQPAPVPMETCTRERGCGFPQVRVMGLIKPTGSQSRSMGFIGFGPGYMGIVPMNTDII